MNASITTLEIVFPGEGEKWQRLVIVNKENGEIFLPIYNYEEIKETQAAKEETRAVKHNDHAYACLGFWRKFAHEKEDEQLLKNLELIEEKVTEIFNDHV